MREIPFDVEVRDSVFNPDYPQETQKVQVRKTKMGQFFKVWLFLDGNDLEYIDAAVYVLPPSFPESERKIRRTKENPRCQLRLWVPGTFTVEVAILDQYQEYHRTTYQVNLKDLPRERERFIFYG